MDLCAFCHLYYTQEFPVEGLAFPIVSTIPGFHLSRRVVLLSTLWHLDFTHLVGYCYVISILFIAGPHAVFWLEFSVFISWVTLVYLAAKWAFLFHFSSPLFTVLCSVNKVSFFKFGVRAYSTFFYIHSSPTVMTLIEGA